MTLFGAAAPAQETDAIRAAYPGAMQAVAVGVDALRFKDDLELRARFDDFVAIGARVLRTDLHWGRVQKDGPDSFDWSEPDRVVHHARAAGLEVMFVVGFTPQWARKVPGERSSIAHPAPYARFLTAAVTRYAPLRLHLWEIWNEPNLTGFWPRPDPKEYAALLKAAYPAVKAADPAATVISGGLAAAPTTGPLVGQVKHVGAAEFVRKLYSEGAGGSFDALGFHPYSYPRRPSDPVGWNGWSIMTGPIRDMMEANGDAGKRIWITEYGAPSNAAKSKVSEDLQAEMLVEAYGLAGALPYAGPVFWYSYRDIGSDPSNNEHWFGLRREDGSPKPAYSAYEQLSRR